MTFDEINRLVSVQVRQEVADVGQMTLGQFIAALEPLPPDKWVHFDFASLGPTELRSYRGYYDHLAFGFEDGSGAKVADVLAKTKAAMGRTFEGYKGGDFVMDEHTPLWAANYGNSGGSRIIGIEERNYDVLIRTQLEND